MLSDDTSFGSDFERAGAPRPDDASSAADESPLQDEGLMSGSNPDAAPDPPEDLTLPPPPESPGSPSAGLQSMPDEAPDESMEVDDGISSHPRLALHASSASTDQAPGTEELPPESRHACTEMDEEPLRPSEEASRPPSAREPWLPNSRAHEVAVELKRIETEIRRLLEPADIKRKRRYEGTRRWHELLEDLSMMRFSGPASEDTLAQIQALVARRMHLFRQLNFIVGTRHRWNT